MAMDRSRLAKKVAWEGGVLAALEYGVRAEQIDDAEISRAWEAVERAYGELTPLVDRVSSLLQTSDPT